MTTPINSESASPVPRNNVSALSRAKQVPRYRADELDGRASGLIGLLLQSTGALIDFRDDRLPENMYLRHQSLARKEVKLLQAVAVRFATSSIWVICHVKAWPSGVVGMQWRRVKRSVALPAALLVPTGTQCTVLV